MFHRFHVMHFLWTNVSIERKVLISFFSIMIEGGNICNLLHLDLSCSQSSHLNCLGFQLSYLNATFLHVISM